MPVPRKIVAAMTDEQYWNSVRTNFLSSPINHSINPTFSKAVMEISPSLIGIKPTAVTHALTTTFLKNLKDETLAARASMMGTYNADLFPYQNEALRYGNPVVTDPVFREKLHQDSMFIAKTIEIPMRRIMNQGWRLVKREESMKPTPFKKEAISLVFNAVAEAQLPETTPMVSDPIADLQAGVKEEELMDCVWTSQLKTAFVDAFSKGASIDTSYLWQWEENVFDVYTRNDEHRLYGNKARQITEVYIRVPAIDMLDEETNWNMGAAVVGALTQYCKDTSRPARYNSIGDPILMEQIKTIHRSCVVIQPKRYVHDVHGFPLLYREMDTALQRMYLRYYELLLFRKGGLNTRMAYNSAADQTIKDYMAKSIYRGIQSLGTILETSSNQPITNQVLIAETAIPISGLEIEAVSSHIIEDSLFTQQEITGKAESGALGGSAPEVSKDTDRERYDIFYDAIAQAIKDVNYVFYDLDPEEYDVEFNLQTQGQTQAEEIDPEGLMPSEPPKTEEKLDLVSDNAINIVQHAVSDEFYEFQGNMLSPGMYLYDDMNRDPIVYTNAEIQAMTQRDIRDGYLDLRHEVSDNLRLFTDEKSSLGYYKIDGFDPATGTDITTFRVRKSVWDNLVQKYPHEFDNNHIHVSPTMYVRKDPASGFKQLYPVSCGIIPKSGKTRAVHSGVKHTTARRLK